MRARPRVELRLARVVVQVHDVLEEAVPAPPEIFATIDPASFRGP